MIALLALAAGAAAEPRAPTSAPRAAATAQATVRVLQPVAASEGDWKEARPAHKREVLVKGADGRMTRLRLIEHE